MEIIKKVKKIKIIKDNLIYLLFSDNEEITLPKEFYYLKYYIKENDIIFFKPNLLNIKEIYKICNNQKIKIYPSFFIKEKIKDFDIIVKELTIKKELNIIRILEKFHYRGVSFEKIKFSRKYLLLYINNNPAGFLILQASNYYIFRETFKKILETFNINYINERDLSGYRISRVVIHPEYRGLDLGILLVKCSILYSKERLFFEKPIKIIYSLAKMGEYHKFFEKAGFIKIPFNYPLFIYFFDKNLEKEFKEKIKNQDENNKENKDFEIIENQNKIISIENLSVKFKVINDINTQREKEILEIFGLTKDKEISIIQNLNLNIYENEVVLIEGASGSGKSLLLKILAGKQINDLIITGKVEISNGKKIKFIDFNFDNSKTLINQIGNDLNSAIKILNLVGLSEAFLYLRKPYQLSEGQKYRFALTQIFNSDYDIFLIDEYCTFLNKEISIIISKNLRKLAFFNKKTVISATYDTSKFIDTLLPSTFIKLKLFFQPKIYSLKIINFEIINNKCFLEFLNKGNFPLHFLQVKIKDNKEFSICNINFLDKNEKIKLEFEKNLIENAKYLYITSFEKVGDIIYFQF